jgi:hypothetical protein
MSRPSDFLSEEAYYEALHEEQMGYEGDARRCPRHPNIKTSSPDGMFDAPCGACEAEMDDAYRAEKMAEPGYCPTCDVRHDPAALGPHSPFYGPGFYQKYSDLF